MKKLFVFLFVSLTVLVACHYVNGKKVEGNGHVVTENRDLTGFSGVESYGSFDVHVGTGNHSVKLEAEDNILAHIETYIDGGILKIRTKKGYWLDPDRDVKIYVTAPTYTRVYSNGSGNIIGENKITGSGKLELGVNGSADISLEVDAPEISADINGSGNAKLKGQTRIFRSQVLGNGDVRALDLLAEETSVKIMGSGNADVYSSVKLNVNVAGSGDVRYKGGGQLNSHIAGSGEVKKLD
jgi:Protein of unknown function (DUF2807).